MTKFIPLAVGIIHAVFCLGASLMQSEGSWGWFLVFLVDLPFSMLLLELAKNMPPLLLFGVFGSAWWYLITFLILKLTGKIIKLMKSGPMHE